MASEIQYRVFKEVYDEESERYSQLGTRCNLYLTIITFYLGVIFLKIDDILKFVAVFQVSVFLVLVLGILFVAALAFTVLALRIREYEGIFDPEEVIDSFGPKPPSDGEFLDKRIVDLAVATNRNSVQNNRVASLLQWSASLIFVAVLLQVVIFWFAIRHAKNAANVGQTQEKCLCAAEK